MTAAQWRQLGEDPALQTCWWRLVDFGFSYNEAFALATLLHPIWFVRVPERVTT